MTSFHRIVIFAALLAPLSTNVLSQSETPGAGVTEGVQGARNYIDASYGWLHDLGLEFLSGGSFLVGRRSFFSQNMFLDEIRVGVSGDRHRQVWRWKINPNAGSPSLGVRPYPHLYIQFGADKGRCDGA